MGLTGLSFGFGAFEFPPKAEAFSAEIEKKTGFNIRSSQIIHQLNLMSFNWILPITNSISQSC